MASLSHTMQRKAFSAAIDVALKRLNKDREKGLLQIIDLAQRFMGDNFKPEAYEGAKKIVQNPDHKWMKFVNTMLDEWRNYRVIKSRYNIKKESMQTDKGEDWKWQLTAAQSIRNR